MSMLSVQTLAILAHIMASALWIGTMVFFLVVLGPAVHELEPRLAIKVLNRGRIGFETISWIAIGTLLLTGIFNLLTQLSMGGGLTSRAYFILLSIKLLFFSAMVVHHCLQVFKYAPVIASLTAQLAGTSGPWPEPLLSHWRRWFLLLKINAVLGPLVVLLGINLVRS